LLPDFRDIVADKKQFGLDVGDFYFVFCDTYFLNTYPFFQANKKNQLGREF
jgi:hypothetical protein